MAQKIKAHHGKQKMGSTAIHKRGQKAIKKRSRDQSRHAPFPLVAKHWQNGKSLTRNMENMPVEEIIEMHTTPKIACMKDSNMPASQVQIVSRLAKLHGDDYEAWEDDHKRNAYQWNALKCKKKHIQYLRFKEVKPARANFKETYEVPNEEAKVA